MTSSPDISSQELRDSIREVLEANTDFSAFAKQSAQQRKHAADELWNRMASLGWMGLAVEERFGGMGLGLRELGVLYEELGRYLVPLPVMTTVLVAQAIGLAGSEEQKARWLPALAAGERRASIALPHIGSGAHVLYADQATHLLIPVRAADGTTELALIDSGDQAVGVKGHEVLDLTRTLAAVSLSGNVPRARLLPLDERAGQTLLNYAAIAIACDAVGAAAHILERTVAYMIQRRQFDRPIGSFQALKHRAASSKVQLEGALGLTRQACELLTTADESASSAASCAKLLACDTFVAIAEDSVQLHGGIGFTWDHECHLFLKRARLDAQLYGCPTEHRERVAKLAFGYVGATQEGR